MPAQQLIDEIVERIQTRALDVKVFKSELAEVEEDEEATEMAERGY
ncbi:MAG: hypothetical protein R3E66_10740 [bacterium]